MLIKVIFICLILFILIRIAYVTRINGFKNLKIERNIDNNKIFVGDTFNIEMFIENRKKLPIAFMLIRELLPKEFEYTQKANITKGSTMLFHISKYSIYKYETIKRKYEIQINERGTYIFNELDLTIGDIFGFSTETKKLEDFNEVVVYPRIKNLDNYRFDTINLLGENIIRRWIYKDPLYIKGIREYTVEDRMKDIHWKSSLKMNKLMVKEYDYTSEREIMLIVNVQGSNEHWSGLEKEINNRATDLAVSICDKCTKLGIPTGMMTNSMIVALSSNYKGEVEPSANSMHNILELCARMDYCVKLEFKKFLYKKIHQFNKNTTYIVITSYLDDESISILSKLSKSGVNMKIIDVSSELNLPQIKGIEKLQFKGEV